MYKSYIPYLQHILDECLYVRSVITDDMHGNAFRGGRWQECVTVWFTTIWESITIPQTLQSDEEPL